MTTPRTRPIVSVAAALSVTLSVAACAGRQPRAEVDPLATIEQAALPPIIRFDNGAGEYVHVYLIADFEQWYLGRVEAGAKATLRVPQGLLVQRPQFVKLAVLPGDRLTVHAAGDPHTSITAAQPTSELVAQRWTFTQGGHLAGLGLLPPGPNGRRR